MEMFWSFVFLSPMFLLMLAMAISLLDDTVGQGWRAFRERKENREYDRRVRAKFRDERIARAERRAFGDLFALLDADDRKVWKEYDEKFRGS